MKLQYCAYIDDSGKTHTYLVYYIAGFGCDIDARTGKSLEIYKSDYPSCVYTSETR